MKLYREQTKLYVAVFLTTYFLSFLFVFSLLVCLRRFNLFINKPILNIAFYSSVALSLIHVVAIPLRMSNNRVRIGKFSNWINMNKPNLLLYYAFSLIFMISVRSEIKWNYNEIKEIITLQWSVFGISTTIFLVWHVILTSYIKDNSLVELEPKDMLSKKINIYRKYDYHQKIQNMFHSVSLMSANLFVLIIATAIVYLFDTDYPIIRENFVRFSLYLCTNTISVLFLDILTPLSKEKKKALEDSKVTNEEVVLQNQTEDRYEKTIFLMKEIDKLSSLTDEEKRKAKAELLRPFVGSILSDKNQDEPQIVVTEQDNH